MESIQQILAKQRFEFKFVWLWSLRSIPIQKIRRKKERINKEILRKHPINKQQGQICQVSGKSLSTEWRCLCPNIWGKSQDICIIYLCVKIYYPALIIVYSTKHTFVIIPYLFKYFLNIATYHSSGWGVDCKRCWF